MTASVLLPVEIAGHPYRLFFDFGMQRHFERETGQRIDHAFPFLRIGEVDPTARESAITKAADQVLNSTWCTAFWAALQKNHMITIEGADDLVNKAGFENVVNWVMRGIVAHLAGDPALAEEGALEGKAGNAKAGKKGK